jgi:hypothetical protein
MRYCPRLQPWNQFTPPIEPHAHARLIGTRHIDSQRLGDIRRRQTLRLDLAVAIEADRIEIQAAEQVRAVRLSGTTKRNALHGNLLRRTQLARVRRCSG